MKKRKIGLLTILIIGIAFLIIAPILGYTLNKTELLNKKAITINEGSNAGLQEAYAYHVSVGKNEKLVIKFSLYYANVTATLKIFGRGSYDQQYALNTSPTLLTGQDFLYSEFAYGRPPEDSITSTDEVDINNNGFWYIEFAGSTSGDYLMSIPGKYVIVVYGENTGPTDTTVKFNLAIKIDGPGEFLEELFYYIGTGVLVCLILFLSYGYYKKLRRGI